VSTLSSLLDEGKLDSAIEQVTASLRAKPDDLQLRTSLFELLCLAGKWDRAEKQLDVLASSEERRTGALLYLGAITAERAREDTVSRKAYGPPPEDGPVGGSLNGTPFSSIADADPRVGARLEVVMGADCMWIPFNKISTVRMEPPTRLRDLIWTPAQLLLRGSEIKAAQPRVLLPALSVFTWRHDDPQVRLGRMTVWEEAGESGMEVPRGQKMLLVDGEEVPLLEIRSLEFDTAAEPESPLPPE